MLVDMAVKANDKGDYFPVSIYLGLWAESFPRGERTTRGHCCMVERCGIAGAQRAAQATLH